MSSPSLSSFFSSAVSKDIPRIAASIDALEKSGKTHWSLFTAPEPIIIVSNDPGTATVYNKAKAQGRKVSLMEITLKEPDRAIRKQDDIDKLQWALWRQEWDRVKAAHAAVIQDKTVRTLVWDTATELWNLAQLSHFGKLQGNSRQDRRTELNADFHKLFWDLYKGRPDLNMLLIHKLKKQYVNNPDPTKPANWNGKYEREGFSRVGFWVDMSLRMGWDSVGRQFYSELDPEQPTRFGSELIGKRWYGVDNTFANLALDVFPDTQWGDPVGPEWWGVK